MALEAALENLRGDLRRFSDVLEGLESTFEHDMPEEGGVKLVETLDERVVELRGYVIEALNSAETALGHEKESREPNQMRRALVHSQQQFLSLQNLFYGEMLKYEDAAELVRFARRAGDRWPGWVHSVFLGLDACRPWLEAASEDYCQAWQELAERATTGPVSLQTTNIGQQISTTRTDSNFISEFGAT